MMRKLVNRQLVMRDRLHAPERIEENDLAGLVTNRNVLREIERSRFRWKAKAAAIEIYYIPGTVLARNYMHRPPRTDYHVFILPPTKRLVTQDRNPNTRSDAPRAQRTL